MISIMDDDRTDEDELADEDPVRRRAREILQRTEPTHEELEAQEERRQRIRSAEIDAMIERAPGARLPGAPSADLRTAEPREQANQLARVVEAPAPASPAEHRVEALWKDLRRYTDNLEKAIGDLVGERDKRAAAAEQRTTSTEARLAQSRQARCPRSEATVIEHEKQPGQ